MYLINNNDNRTAYISSKEIRNRDFSLEEWREASDDEIEIIVVKHTYEQLSKIEQEKFELRQRREVECFAIINRNFFFNEVTIEEMTEINEWYTAWLNVTETLVVPTVPKYIADRIS